jgi:hypothetical protein
MSQHLAPGKPGTKTDRLVSFEDFGPTVLSLTESKIPAYMEGKPFLGKSTVKERDYTFGHRDRVDEVLDLSRSVHDKKYHYVRHFMPHRSYNQPTSWPDLGEIRHEFYRLTNMNSMNKAQWHFAGPRKAVEELYDSVNDPMNLTNLIEDPKYQAVLERMRAALFVKIKEKKDLGFIPEAMAWEWTKGTTPYDFARNNKSYNQQEIVDAASQVGLGSSDDFVKSLNSKNAAVRYWGAVGFSASAKLSLEGKVALLEALGDKYVNVRVEAANALLTHGESNAAKFELKKALKDDNMAAVLHAARTIELLGAKVKSLVPAMKEADALMLKIRPPGTPATVVQPGRIDMSMFVKFSTVAFLNKQGMDGDKGAEGAKDGWVDIFDGKTLNGWKANFPDQSVKVVDGEIHIMSKGKNLWLLHEKVYKDFEVELEAKMPDVYNSGLGFRCKAKGKKPTGYQCEIDEKKSGAIYAIGKGWVFGPKGKDWEPFFKISGDSYKTGEWNKFKVHCVGNKIKVWVNGHLTADVTDDKFKDGVFALQHHGKGDVHKFRNVRVKEIK